jgi:two-component system, cell cycle sensor histidine kinase and response regulator CckA
VDSTGILLAEDDFQIRMLLIELLKSNGYTVFDAEDGAEAVELYEKNKDSIHLLLLDLGLPKMTGVEVYRQIKVQKPNIKIIAMSGWGQRETVDELYEEGINLFIQKPYKPSDIIRSVRTVLQT